ncbi:MAG: zf-HC2 domain-containing protein [Verrucomicrobia bacterium]|nr:zf-HC2 domain-containing protein [Verrucomicrobiota bacterium]
MKCDDLLALLNDYVDGDVAPALCAELEHHLAGCNPCQVVVDNIRQTITLYKAGEPYPLPLEFRNRLHAALHERWQHAPTGDSAPTRASTEPPPDS